MACTFSPALVAKPAKPASTATTTADKSAFACLPFAGDGSIGGGGIGGKGHESVYERLYNMRGRTEVRQATD